MKIGFAADLHFERGGDAGVSQYEKSFGEMVAGMIQRGIHIAVFGGDIFNRWSSFNPRTFRILTAGLKDLMDNKIEVVVMAGNHDYDISGTYPAIAPLEMIGVHVVVKPRSFAMKTDAEYTHVGDRFPNDTMGSYRVLFTFLPWITKGMAKEAGIDLKQPTEVINESIYNHFVRPTLEESRKDVPRHDKAYLFFHASIFGADMGSMRCIESVDFTLYPDRIQEYGYSLCVGGHFHRRQEHKGMIYVGSMERQNFGERDNPTGWMLIEGKKYEFVELHSPLRFGEIYWDFTTHGNFDAFMNQFGAFRYDEVSIKFKYKIRRNDAFDRAVVIDAIYKLGATSVVLAPEYVDEVQFRSEIRAEQSFDKQFTIWRDANPEKDSDGALSGLLERERQSGFPAVVDVGHITDMMNGGGS